MDKIREKLWITISASFTTGISGFLIITAFPRIIFFHSLGALVIAGIASSKEISTSIVTFAATKIKFFENYKSRIYSAFILKISAILLWFFIKYNNTQHDLAISIIICALIYGAGTGIARPVFKSIAQEQISFTDRNKNWIFQVWQIISSASFITSALIVLFFPNHIHLYYILVVLTLLESATTILLMSSIHYLYIRSGNNNAAEDVIAFETIKNTKIFTKYEIFWLFQILLNNLIASGLLTYLIFLPSVWRITHFQSTLIIIAYPIVVSTLQWLVVKYYYGAVPGIIKNKLYLYFMVCLFPILLLINNYTSLFCAVICFASAQVTLSPLLSLQVLGRIRTRGNRLVAISLYGLAGVIGSATGRLISGLIIELYTKNTTSLFIVTAVIFIIQSNMVFNLNRVREPD